MFKLELRADNKELTTRDLLEVALSGANSTDEVLKGAALAAQWSDGKTEIWLTPDDYAFLLARVQQTRWNVFPATRKAVSDFITHVRGLKETEVEVTDKTVKANG